MNKEIFRNFRQQKKKKNSYSVFVQCDAKLRLLFYVVTDRTIHTCEIYVCSCQITLSEERLILFSQTCMLCCSSLLTSIGATAVHLLTTRDGEEKLFLPMSEVCGMTCNLHILSPCDGEKQNQKIYVSEHTNMCVHFEGGLAQCVKRWKEKDPFCKSFLCVLLLSSGG